MKVWQKRFGDHVIRDEVDFGRHLDYVHYNPVKHGWTGRPDEWRHSSFAHWKNKGIYQDEWGWVEPEYLGEWQVAA